MSQVDIKITVDNYKNSPVILGYYYNNQMLVRDTVITDETCVARYKRDENLAEGIYMLYIPDKSYVDIILGNDQTFDVSCDTLPRMSERVTTEGSQMMTDFINYQHYLGEKQEYYKELSDRYKQVDGNDELRAQIKAEYAKTDKEVKTRNLEIIEQNRGNCLAVFLDGLRDIEIPDFDLSNVDETKRDSVLQQKRYYYYREHYFDNLSMKDNRILRTPYFVQKLDKYFNDVLPQIPDTVADECIRVIEMTKGDDEMYRYVVSHLYNMMNNSKIMGMDAALVAIADNYYLKGLCPWADKKFLDELTEQVGKIRWTLLGRKAVNLKQMPSVTGEYFSLYEVDAPYTILVFWEPSCGHCKKEIPELKKVVWDKYASKGIKIFAVYCQTELEPWQNFIEENSLEEWMNVYDPQRKTGFRNYYNINSTPQIFILDKDKTIIAKKIGVDQIGGFLDYMFEKDKH